MKSPRASRSSRSSRRAGGGLSWRDLLVWLLLLLAILGLWGHSRRILEANEGLGLLYRWDWQHVMQFFATRKPSGVWRPGPLLSGLVSTIKLAIYSILVGVLLGVPAGILQTQKLRLLRLPGQFYVEFIRNIPPLVVVMVFYFFFASPLVDWLGIETLSRKASVGLRAVLGFFFDLGSKQNNLVLGNFFAAVLILGIYEGSYIAEIVRAGIQAIPEGQHRASFALGMSPRQNYQLVILPQTFRTQLPALTNQFASAIKDSSIVSLISIQELAFRSQQVITTTRAFVESSLVMLLLYLLLTGFCSLLSGSLQQRVRLH